MPLTKSLAVALLLLIFGRKFSCQPSNNGEEAQGVPVGEGQDGQGQGQGDGREVQEGQGQGKRDLIFCPPLKIPDNVIGEGYCVTDTFAGRSCKFKCKENVTLEGAQEIFCTDEVKWSNEVPTCPRIPTPTENCPALVIPVNVIAVGNCQDAKKGQSCTFKCKDNAPLEGNAELYCNWQLQWSGKVPQCKISQQYCPPLEIPNDVTAYGHCVNATIGEACKFKCDEGLTLEGEDEIFCTALFKWHGSVPRCTNSRVCKFPARPDHGDVQCSDDIAECEFSCNRDYVLDGPRIITCYKGKWSDRDPRCIKDKEYHPYDCADIKRWKPSSENDVYMIWPKLMNTSVEVRCDMTTDNGGWTVIQRRGDYKINNVSENFYRSWEDYVNGFGDKKREYWLGLDAINAISSDVPHTLRIDMTDFDNASKYAKYTSFWVSGPREQYKLEISGFSGDAGDSLEYHNNHRFSAKDSGQMCCVKLFKGGWWYDWCLRSDLNGAYMKGKHESSGEGIVWETFRGLKYSLKSAEMKMRPRDYYY